MIDLRSRRDELARSAMQIPSLPLPAALLPALEAAATDPARRDAELGGLLALSPALACRALAASSGLAGGTLLAPEDCERLPEVLGGERMREILKAALRDEIARAGGESQRDAPAAESRARTRREDDTRPERGLWGHSVATGLAAGLIARWCKDPRPYAAQLAGLLHDIGKHALAAAEPSAYRLLRAGSQKGRMPWCEAERRMGLQSHTLVGHRLASNWRFPPELRAVVLHHHEPDPNRRPGLDERANRLVDIVIVADGMARRLNLGNPGDNSGSPAWGALTRQRLGLDREDVTLLSVRLEAAFEQSLAQVLPGLVLPRKA